MSQTVARSISRPVRELLHQGRFDARVLAVFEQACDLLTSDGQVVALVTPHIGDGPLNVVVDGAQEIFARIYAGAPVRLAGERLWVGAIGIELGNAATWEPCPDWDTLRARRTAILPHLAHLRALCLDLAPAGSFLALLGAPAPGNAVARDTLSAAQAAAEALREGWEGDREQLRAAAAGLAGLGGGLTPAGDDFLAGAMLRAWLVHPTPGPPCRTLIEVAAPRTTALSAAFLRAAARGECSAPWHALLAALAGDDEKETTAAARDVLSHGATSGADSLAGFLYEQEPPPQPSPVGTGEGAAIRSSPRSHGGS